MTAEPVGDPDTLPCLTIHQPYASLIMHGVKWWETRPSPPNGNMRPDGVRGLPGHRIDPGDRIAIHAAAKPTPNVDGLCEAWANDGTPVEVSADYSTLFIRRNDGTETRSDEWTSHNTVIVDLCYAAVLGTVKIWHAAPIIAAPEDLWIEDPVLGEVVNVDDHAPSVVVDGPSLTHMNGDLWNAGACGGPGGDISDQLPYGDWRPGRWAWLLDDPQPYVDPVPAKGRPGFWNWELPA